MIDSLLEIMGVLVDLFKDYYRLQFKLEKFILSRDSENLNLCIEDMQKAVMSINMVEKKRDAIYQKLRADLGLREDDDFSFLLAKLEKSDADKLNKAREELKYHVFASQRMGISMAQILDTKISMINLMLTEIYPEKKDTTYSSKGSYGIRLKRSNEAKILDYEF